MASIGASIHTNPAVLFGVEGQVAVVTGGGTGTVFSFPCSKSCSSDNVF